MDSPLRNWFSPGYGWPQPALDRLDSFARLYGRQQFLDRNQKPARVLFLQSVDVPCRYRRRIFSGRSVPVLFFLGIDDYPDVFSDQHLGA